MMLESIEAYLASCGVSAVSLLSYRRDLERLERHLGDRAEQADRETLCAYLRQVGKALSPTSLSRHVSVLRSYYRFLMEQGLRGDHPMTGLYASHFYGKEGVLLTRKDFQRLLRRQVSGFRGQRDLTLFMLLLETGIRISELCALNRGDVNEGVITCGSGARRRTLTLMPTLSAQLARYLAISSLYLPESGEAPLFITTGGERMTRQAIWRNLKENVILCGIDQNVSPQVLRRSFAHMCLEEKVNRDALRRLLGNADTASLRSYQIRRKKEL